MKDFGFQWHLTNRCNLRCRHCYQEEFGRSGELDFEAHKLVAKEIFEAVPDRAVSVNLTGGEPFLLPWLGDLVEFLHTFQNLGEICVITNGTKQPSHKLEKLISGKKITGLKVSLESADPDVNDRIRGKGNFETVSSNLEEFLARGFAVTLMATMARYNISSIEKTLHWARERGVAGIIFERFVPFGTGAALKKEALDVADWNLATEAIVRAAELSTDKGELEPVRALWLDTSCAGEISLKGALCNLGDESMAVMPDGTVYPCRRLPVPIGSILKDSFTQILSQLAKFEPSTVQCENASGICTGCRALDSSLN